MNQFKCKQLFSLKNTKEKPPIGRAAMEEGISDHPADTPTKKPPKMKRARAFVRGCARAVLRCIGLGRKANGPPRNTDTGIGKCCGY